MMNLKATLPALLAAPLLLAGCAPAVQNSPVYTQTRSFAATCADALSAVLRTAPGVRPTVFDSGGALWSYYAATRSGDTVTTVSKSTLTSDRVTATWTCQQNGASAGLRVDLVGLGPTDSYNSATAVYDKLQLLRG